MFISYLPRRVTYGLILVFARPLVFRSAAKARNPYTHGVKGGVKTPSFLTGFTTWELQQVYLEPEFLQVRVELANARESLLRNQTEIRRRCPLQTKPVNHRLVENLLVWFDNISEIFKFG